MKSKQGICGLCFHSPGCGVIVHFDKDGRIDRLDPDPCAPAGRVLCPIAQSAKEIVYSETRLKTPLKRTGPKGSFEFEPVSWEEAMETIAQRLNALKETHGPETVAIYAGTGTYERSYKDIYQLKGSEIYLAANILFPFGSPNTFGVGAPCYTSLGVLAPKLTMGCLHTEMFSDIDNSELVLVWGTDPSTATPPEMFERLKIAADEGADIIVIDPRKTPCADLPGSEWLPIRPGSDGALALGLAHILIRDRRFDHTFMDTWTLGFPEFADYVKEFPPEETARITGIDAGRIRRLADEIVQADGASYIMYTGLEYTKSGVQNIRAVMVLWALAGQLDVAGGRCFLGPGTTLPLGDPGRVEMPPSPPSIAQGRFPVYSHFCGNEPHAHLLPEAIIHGEPYPIRGLLVQGASLQTSWPDPALWRRALDTLEFLTVIDIQMTRDAAWADIVLPATTAFEQESYCYYGSAIRWREPMIEPVGKARPNADILAELARHLGYGHLYPQTQEERIHRVLTASGITREALMAADRYTIRLTPPPMQYKKWEKGLLRRDGQPGFDTPSGRIEIQSTLLERHGYHGLPRYDESDETPVSRPDLLDEYPLILGTGPFKPDMKSCLRGIPGFIKRYPHPTVEIHPKDAEKRRIRENDPVLIRTPRGRVNMRAHLTDRIMQGMVYAPVGGGGPLDTKEWQAANVNQVTDFEQFDPISGFPIYKTLMCQVKKRRKKKQGITVQDPSLGCVG